MKTRHAALHRACLVALVLAPFVPVAAQNPSPAAPTVPGAAEPPKPPPAAETMPAPPVVRIPVTPPLASPAANVDAGAGADTAPVNGTLNPELGWSSEAIDLRSPGGASALRTNRVIEPKGVATRAAKPERKGFGGFLGGFANLFNPFAPTDQGIEARDEHWYDSQINPAALPRGFRDERFHEPKTELFVTGLERKRKSAPAAVPAESTEPSSR